MGTLNFQRAEVRISSGSRIRDPRFEGLRIEVMRTDCTAQPKGPLASRGGLFREDTRASALRPRLLEVWACIIYIHTYIYI